MSMFRSPVICLLLILCSAYSLPAADPAPEAAYLEFIRNQAAALRAQDKQPSSIQEWNAQREAIRNGLQAAWGKFPETPCPLEAKVLGELKRDGYTVENVIFQTRPGVWMTANAYVPDRKGKLPAILQVHGHWRGAKQDPVVQARCIGAAKLGFFVLVVDAFGAGERGIGKALGEYHGSMTGATLFPIGMPLSGMQVYENMRAVDYLKTRPEVDSTKIGITGASGGGNQTMYAGAWDDRIGASVPVCSVGNYQAYLGAACCMCEVVPGALTFTEEWGILGLTAPRGLMVVNATKDARQFSVAEAKKSITMSENVFKLFEKPKHAKHVIFESPHDYNKAMREAMYGWMTLHLKGEGDGSPITEPVFKTEDPEALRCFPGTTRPDSWVTIPRFAKAEATKILASKPEYKSADQWMNAQESLRSSLINKVLGGFPASKPKTPLVSTKDGSMQVISFETEAGLKLNVALESAKESNTPLVLLLNMDGATTARQSELAKEIREAGWSLATMDLRATGQRSVAGDKIGRAPDHNSAEWGLWIGRPLLGQWAYDVQRALDTLHIAVTLPKEVVVIGDGPAGLVAITAAATDTRITHVAAVGSLSSYVTDEPYVGQWLGFMAPGILRDVGDVAHLAALIAPRRLVLASGVASDGKRLDQAQMKDTYSPTMSIYKLLNQTNQLQLLEKSSAREVLGTLRAK